MSHKIKVFLVNLVAGFFFISLALVIGSAIANGLLAQNEKEPNQNQKKLIVSVTWDLKEHKLIWIVQNGSKGPDGKFEVKSTGHYEISPDEAIMSFANEKRRFTSEEAASLHKLLDTLTVYCAESVVWWDRGEGQKLDDKNRPILPDNIARLEHK